MAVLVTFLQAWTIFFVLVKVLESLSGGLISSLLSRHSIKLHFCFISVHTTYFNTALETYSRRRKSLLTYWYTLGVFCGFLGAILSLCLLLSNLSLSLLDLLRPLPPDHPPPPRAFIPAHGLPGISSSSLPPPHHPRLHHALSLASPRAPAARVPFLHHARRPWFIPPAYWARLSPRDHAAGHAIALTSRMEAAPGRWRRPSRRFHAAGFYDFPPPPPRGGHHHRHHGPPPGGGRRRDPNRPPCKNRPPQTPWDPFHRGAQQALPAPALAGPETNVVFDGEGDTKDEVEEKDLIENGEKNSITITWRGRKPLSVAEEEKEEEGDEAQTSARFDAGGTNSTSGSSYAGPSSGTAHSQSQSSAASRNAFLTPLVPGVTVPAGDLWYMIGAVLIAAVVHELGHALAAGMQNAQVSGIGGFVALLLPGAYVQLGGIEDLSPWNQLKVYCAGAWHNLVSAILALVVVGWLPALMSGFYLCQEGAMVVAVPELSPLSGHVEPGDIIRRLGQFNVSDGGPSFRLAVSNLVLSNDSVGFCVPEDLYRNYSKSRSPCCQDEYLQNIDYGESLDHKCFRVEGIENRTSCLDPVAVSTQPTCRQTRECSGLAAPGNMGHVVSRSDEGMPIGGLRLDTVNRAAAPVSAGDGGEGDSSGTEEDAGDQAEKTSCFVPILPMQQQLVDVLVRSGRTGNLVHFFYEGYPQVLGQSVTVSSYVPRIWWIAPFPVTQVLASVDIPNMIERLVQYFSSISLALAILNMAPVFFLDGEMSSVLFVRIFAPKMPTTTAMRIKAIMVFSGTVLLVLNMIIALLEMEHDL